MTREPSDTVAPLTRWERTLAVVLGLAILCAPALLMMLPPEEIVTQSSDGSWTSTQKPRDTSYLSIGACCISLALFLYAINGLRIVRFSAGNVSVDASPTKEAQKALSKVKSVDPAADQPIDASIKTPESTATPEIVETAKGPFEYYKLSEVPAQVLQDAITKWPADNDPPTDFTDFMFALRKKGRGNHPWIIKLRDRVPVVVSYGGQGKLEATVTKA